MGACLCHRARHDTQVVPDFSWQIPAGSCTVAWHNSSSGLFCEDCCSCHGDRFPSFAVHNGDSALFDTRDNPKFGLLQKEVKKSRWAQAGVQGPKLLANPAPANGTTSLMLSWILCPADLTSLPSLTRNREVSDLLKAATLTLHTSSLPFLLLSHFTGTVRRWTSLRRALASTTPACCAPTGASPSGCLRMASSR